MVRRFNVRTLDRLLMLGGVLVLSVGCDQATKLVAMQTLKSAPIHSYWGDLFRLEYAENPGAFLSLGANLTDGVRASLLTGAVGVFLVGLLLFAALNRSLGLMQVVAYALTLGGGWSNWIDRFIRHGLVVDFMNLGVGRLRTGIFNVADLAIVAGIALLVLAPGRPRLGPANATPQAPPADDPQRNG
jgi:signal peptidase II